MQYTQIVLSSDGWKNHAPKTVVPLTEKYKHLGMEAVLEYAKALSEAHLKDGNAAALMGVHANGKIVLIEMFYKPQTAKTF